MARCANCRRHIAPHETSCPFCGAEVLRVVAPALVDIEALSPVPAYGVAPTPGRIALRALVLALLAAGGAALAWGLMML